MKSVKHTLIGLALLGVLSACVSSEDAEVSRAEPVQTVEVREVADAQGAAYCEAKDIAPAIIETVTEQVEATPAQLDANGKIIHAATYQTVTRQEIVRERQELWFKTPCAAQMTPEFIASLQRALHARGLYQGRDHGILDQATKRAIRRIQSNNGLDSDVLSLETARNMGLLAYDFVRG